MSTSLGVRREGSGPVDNRLLDGGALLVTPPAHATAPAQTATVYQRIVTTFNEHPEKVFRVRDLHEPLGLPTDEPSINVTRSRLG